MTVKGGVEAEEASLCILDDDRVRGELVERGAGEDTISVWGGEVVVGCASWERFSRGAIVDGRGAGGRGRELEGGEEEGSNKLMKVSRGSGGMGVGRIGMVGVSG